MPEENRLPLYLQNSDLSQLELALDYQFSDQTLLATALTHRSFTHEHRELSIEHNQRLEFLGDAVLGLSIATAAYRVEPAIEEGQMTKLRAAIVCEESLADCAIKLNLAKYMQLGKGEIQDGGREKPSILADAMEAIFAAIYLEAGYERAAKSIVKLMSPYIHLALAGKLWGDYKSQLLEYAQSLKVQLRPSFEIVSSTGPVHKQWYTARAGLGKLCAEGSGSTKKQAEQQAAKQLLNML